MSVKYHCPKCEKRFVDWGAKKLDFKCPDCDEEQLVVVGFDPARVQRKKKPSLKRKPKTVVKLTPPPEEGFTENPKAKGGDGVANFDDVVDEPSAEDAAVVDEAE